MLMLLLLMPTSHCAILWIFAHCVIRIVAYFVHFCRRERENENVVGMVFFAFTSGLVIQVNTHAPVCVSVFIGQ